MNQELIHLLIIWAPSALFVLILLISILIGYFHGLRKSMIYLVHAVILTIICLILFFSLVNNNDFDAWLVWVTNQFLGEGGIQKQLGVSESLTTYREILYEFIPKQMNLMDGINLIIQDNGKYLNTLVDMAYRLIFALVLYVLFIIFDLILILFHYIFNPEWRAKRRRNRAYQDGLIDTPWRKNHLGGVILNGTKGLVYGLVFLSFIGSFYFILAGGKGQRQSEDYTFDNETYNLVYGAYQSIGEYGTDGIYKVLNLIEDEKETPYYLYAADLVFQGGVKDLDGNTESVYFREELANYVKFSRDTFDLVLKYGGEELEPVFNGTYKGDVMELVLTIMGKNAFQKEFRTIITNFEENSYFINLTLSLLDSAVNYIEELELDSTMPNEVTEIIKILFQKGYKSKTIPYEAYLIENNIDKELAYIKPSKLLIKEDIYAAYDIFIDYVNVVNNHDLSDSENLNKTIIAFVKEMAPDIKKLSILSSDRRDELNPVLRRIYAYVEQTYLNSSIDLGLTSLSSSLDENPYEDYESNSIDWVGELYTLVDVLDRAISIYSNIVNYSNNFFDLAFTIYDPADKNYYENSTNCDKILSYLSESQILGEALKSKMMEQLITDGLSSLIDTIYIPTDISYSSTYDDEGRLIQRGELYYLLNGIRAIAMDKSNKTIINTLGTTANPTNEDILNMFSSISDALLKNDSTGCNLVEYLSNSKLLVSLSTAYLRSNLIDLGDINIYIDESILEKDAYGNTLNLLKKTEFEQFFYSFKHFLPTLEYIITGGDMDEIMNTLTSKDFTYALDSKILEGTISNALPTLLGGNDMIIIPASLRKGENLLSTEDHPSEIRILASLMDHGLDLSVFTKTYSTEEEQTNAILDAVRSLKEEDLIYIFQSNILEYSISDYLIHSSENLIDGLELILPDTARNYLENDVLDYTISIDALVDLILNLGLLIPEDSENIEFGTFIKSILDHEELLDNQIILTTFVNALCNNPDIKESYEEFLTIPEKYLVAGKESTLKENFTIYNIWNKELKSLIFALDEMLEIKDKENFSFEDDSLTDTIYDNVTSLNDASTYNPEESKLDFIYHSEIFMASISKTIDQSFMDFVDASDKTRAENTLKAAKYKNSDYYTKEEMKGLVEAISIFDIDLKEGINETAISNQIQADIISYNKSTNGEASTLSKIYQSAIVRFLFTNEIDDLELLNEQKSALLKDSSGNYYENEVSAMIDTLEIFGLNDLNEAEKIENTVKDSLSTLLNTHEGESISNLEYLYDKGNVFSLLFTDALESAKDLTIPRDAYFYNVFTNDREDFISYTEANALIQAIDNLGISITDGFTTDSIDLDNLDPTIISQSIIISSSLYSSLKEEEDVIIPRSTLNFGYTLSNMYIRQEEMEIFLQIAQEFKDTLFEKNGTSYDLTTIALDADTISPALLIRMEDSKIFNATVVHSLLENNLADDLTIPSSYKDDGTDEKLEFNSNNLWFKNKEISKLANALTALDVTNMGDTQEENFYNNTITAENLLGDYQGQTKLAVLYQSVIFASTISSQIITNLTDDIILSSVKYNHNYYNHSYEEAYDLDEIEDLLNSFTILDLDVNNLDNVKTNGLDINTFISLEQYKREDIYESYLIRGIITKNIGDYLKDEDSMLKDSPLAYENAYTLDIEVYRTCELEAIVNLLNNPDSSGDIESLDLDSIKITDIKESIYDSNGLTNSYLTVASITNTLIDNEDIYIPKSDYDTLHSIIYPKSIYDLMCGIEAFDLTNIDINIDAITLPGESESERRDIITNSNILLASITHSLTFSFNSSNIDPYIEYQENYVSRIKDYNNDYILCVTKEEGMGLLEVLTKLASNLDVSMNLTTMATLSTSDFEKSSTIRTTISMIVTSTYYLYSTSEASIVIKMDDNDKIVTKEFSLFEASDLYSNIQTLKDLGL